MLQVRLVAQKDFKKQVLILRILSEICKDCFDVGSEYITRHYFEEIFDINHII